MAHAGPGGVSRGRVAPTVDDAGGTGDVDVLRVIHDTPCAGHGHTVMPPV